MIRSFPEVERVFGKVGRAETATDPAPLSMVETTITLKPESEWRAGMTPERLTNEMNRAIRVPGVTNAWTMPIKTRIDMLSTGIKTPVGIKVSGPDLAVLDRVGREIESVIRGVPGTLSVYAERVTGGNYLNLEIDRTAIARYGLTIGDVEDVIQSAIGGMNITTLIFTFTDSPEELANGRSLFIFTLPIAISSLILIPEASFLFALIGGGIITGLAYSIDQSANVFAIIGFFMLALVSWLSARSLELALKELRVINTNLDQVVTQRTRALAESLSRERVEAGRNQAILNSIADGVIVFDRKWKAILVNPAIRGMLELPGEVIVNRNFRELIEHPKLSANGRRLPHRTEGGE